MLAWTFQMTTCVRAYEYCERSKRIARTSRASRRNSVASCSPSPGSSQSPSATISSEWRKPFDAPNGKPRRNMTARPSSRPGLRVQRRSPVFAPLWLEPPKPEDLDERPRLNKERDCYVCKQPFSKVHRYYDSMCEPCGDFNYAKREQTRGPERPVRVDHRRAREDRLPGFAQTTARRGACHRHDALPGRCR